MIHTETKAYIEVDGKLAQTFFEDGGKILFISGSDIEQIRSVLQHIQKKLFAGLNCLFITTQTGKTYTVNN